MPPRKQIANDPMVSITGEGLELSYPWSSSERVTTQVVSFRVQPKYVALLERLRTNPASPYYGLFPTQDDLERHIYIRAVLAILNSVKTMSPGIQDIILKERIAAEIAFHAKRRENLQENVEQLMLGIEQHLAVGSDKQACEFLDKFVANILTMQDLQWKDEYAHKLLNNHILQINRDRLAKGSLFLEALEDEYE